VRKLDSNNLINSNQLSSELKNRLIQALDSSKQSILDKEEGKTQEIVSMSKTEEIKKHEQINEIEEIKELLTKIELEVERLNQLFWSKKELDELQFVVDFFEARIQNMIQATLKNLDWYQNEGWKRFLNKEDDLQ